MNLKDSVEKLQARLGLRRSSAAQRHRDRTKFYKADRKKWKGA